MTNNIKIMLLVEDYTIPFQKIAQQKSGRKIFSTAGNSRDVEQGSHCRDLKPLQRKISNLLLVEKKDEGNQPVINLKEINQSTPYQHFKRDGLHCLCKEGILMTCVNWI